MAGATSGEATVTIAAPPTSVYELVSDISRMGDWSPECRGGEWVGGASGPEVGAMFRGDNRMGPYRWSTTSKIVAASPGREFAFTVILRGRESTRWRYQFEPISGGTAVTESYEFVWAPWHIVLADVLIGRDWQLRRGLRRTLARLKTTAERK